MSTICLTIRPIAFDGVWGQQWLSISVVTTVACFGGTLSEGLVGAQWGGHGQRFIYIYRYKTLAS